MRCWALACCVVLLSPGIAAWLPAPINVSVDSRNFQHVLRWAAGPGTPAGTRFRVYSRVEGKKKKRPVKVTTSTRATLKLNNRVIYRLSVEALGEHGHSAESTCTFSPYRDTKIGPPLLALSGGGNCIQINVSLPQAHSSSGIADLQRFYTAQFRVVYRTGKNPVGSYLSGDRSYTLSNLNSGTEYCVQVHTEITVNKNTEPSPWRCVFTSSVEPRPDPVVLGAAASIAVLALGAGSGLVFCLHYAGFLCPVKALRPRALVRSLPGRTPMGQAYTLTPEGTSPDAVSISSERHRKHCPPLSQEEDEEDEDEDEDEQVSTDPTSRSGHSAPRLYDHRGFEAEGWSFEAEGRSSQGADVIHSSQCEENQSGGQEATSIDLFSVTLAALRGCEEEEEEEEEDEEDQLTPHTMAPTACV